MLADWVEGRDATTVLTLTSSRLTDEYQHNKNKVGLVHRLSLLLGQWDSHADAFSDSKSSQGRRDSAAV